MTRTKSFAVFGLLLALCFALFSVAAPADAVPVATALAFDRPGLLGLGLAGLIINRANLDAMFTGYKAAFQGGLTGVTPMWNKVATRVPSTTKKETYGWLGQFPKLREWIGDRHLKDLSAFGYALENKPYEATVEVDRDEIEDDSYGIYTPMMSEMGRAAAIFPDEQIFPLLAAGISSLCYDGQYFFDTDHPVGSGTASNVDSGGGGAYWYLMDNSRVIKPLLFQDRKAPEFVAMTKGDDESVFMRKKYRYGVDCRANFGFGFWQFAFASNQTLNTANFYAARGAMMGFKSDEGRPLGINATTLVTGVSNLSAAETLINTQNLASGASNTLYKSVDLYVCPWLP